MKNIKFNNFNWHSISTSEANKWEKVILLLKDLGSESDIESFMFQGASKDYLVIYFDQIKLVKSDYVDNGKCSDKDDPDDRGSGSESNIDNINLWLIINIIMLVLLFN